MYGCNQASKASPTNLSNTEASAPGCSLSNSTRASLLYRSTRIISGEQLKKRKYDQHQGKVEVSSIANRNDTLIEAVFDDAFSLQTIKDEEQEPLMMSSMTKATDSTNHEQITRLANKTNQSNVGTTWTKSKLKALDTQIASLTNASKSDHPIVITKDMLLKAEFVAQLDSKFIVVNMCGILCLVDQHAADERVGLERLEEALQKNMSSLDLKQQQEDQPIYPLLFDLSKLKNIRTDHLFKRTPLKNPKSIDISPSLSSVIDTCKTIIKQWNFDYDHDTVHHKVLLKSVPSICNKVATEKDFLQFVQFLGHQTAATATATTMSKPSSVQPAFVKRTLASYACRYAIMFGDVLDEDTCRSLLSSLSKCELCFICAHGRPSIVPLVDLNLMPFDGGYSKHSSSSSRGNLLPKNSGDRGGEERIPIRFRHLYPQNQKSRFNNN
jgi:DNA mismatch repair enzyme (predicted ATPase)